MNIKKVSEDLTFFKPYFVKIDVLSKLKFMQVFSDFENYYSAYKSNAEDKIADKILKTLVQGLIDKKISINQLDELLFYLIEDSLFNSFIYKFNSDNITEQKNWGILLKTNWKIAHQNKILNNVKTMGNQDFIICGYREILNDKDEIETLRIMLLDRQPLNYRDSKDNSTYEAIYPTLIELDFRRNLLHIRIKDVDNIVNTSEKYRTMSGRINNTLNFIDRFSPVVNYEVISSFKSTLYRIEENLLANKRDLAYQTLKPFEEKVREFASTVESTFPQKSNQDISTFDYIRNGVLSVIANNIEIDELSDVIGIKFRDNKEVQTDKYAEIKIMDKSNSCISTHNLYWLNLPVLQNQKKVEFLKIAKRFENGLVIANLEFSLDTCNIKLLQRGDPEDRTKRKPSQEKYDDLINYIMNFL